MAIQNRRGLDTDFNPNKMLPGEIAVSTDNKKIYVCFEAGTVKRMATHEDFSDMLDAIQNIVETGTQMIDDFEVLAVEKCNINDTDISTLTTFSSKKINDLFNDYYDKNELYNKTEIDEKEELLDDRIIANEDGIKTILGNLASEYSTSQTYVVGDYCIYDSKLYRCTTATAEAWTSAHWTLTDCGSEFKTLNSNLDTVSSDLADTNTDVTEIATMLLKFGIDKITKIAQGSAYLTNMPMSIDGKYHYQDLAITGFNKVCFIVPYITQMTTSAYGASCTPYVISNTNTTLRIGTNSVNTTQAIIAWLIFGN